MENIALLKIVIFISIISACSKEKNKTTYTLVNSIEKKLYHLATLENFSYKVMTFKDGTIFNDTYKIESKSKLINLKSYDDKNHYITYLNIKMPDYIKEIQHQEYSSDSNLKYRLTEHYHERRKQYLYIFTLDEINTVISYYSDEKSDTHNNILLLINSIVLKK